VLLMRSATHTGSDALRYTRRTVPQADEADSAISERSLWDALDAGRDPTDDNKGR
jgi:uncharacterized membrane protein (TIGR02234 family)